MVGRGALDRDQDEVLDAGRFRGADQLTVAQPVHLVRTGASEAVDGRNNGPRAGDGSRDVSRAANIAGE